MVDYLMFEHNDCDGNEEDELKHKIKKKDYLIYYKNRESILYTFKVISLILWILCWLIDILYHFLFVFYVKADDFKDKNQKFDLSDCHLLLALINFWIPTLLNIAEAWS